MTVLHKTSSTEFCVSCHSMQTPLAEYQGSVHFQNTKGIRAECADCHIPGDPTSYLWTKIRAVKDIYHEAIGTPIPRKSMKPTSCGWPSPSGTS